QAAVEIVGPAVIAARDPAILDPAGRQLDLAVRAAVFDGAQPAVTRPEERESRVPGLDLDHLPGPEVLVVLDRVPVGRIELGGPRASTQRGGIEDLHGSRRHQYTPGRMRHRTRRQYASQSAPYFAWHTSWSRRSRCTSRMTM